MLDAAIALSIINIPWPLLWNARNAVGSVKAIQTSQLLGGSPPCKILGGLSPSNSPTSLILQPLLA